MWDVVAQCRASGRLEALRDGRMGDGSMDVGDEVVGSRHSDAKVKKKRKKKAVQEVEGEKEEGEEGEESEGGFFDE